MCLQDVAIGLKLRAEVVEIPFNAPLALTGSYGGQGLYAIAANDANNGFRLIADRGPTGFMTVPCRTYQLANGSHNQFWDQAVIAAFGGSLRLSFDGAAGSDLAILYFLDPVHFAKALGM